MQVKIRTFLRNKDRKIFQDK